VKPHLIIGITVICTLLSFISVNYQPQYSTAEAQCIQGVYIYTDCKPVLPFDSIGYVELGFVSGTQYESIRQHFIKKTKKQFPEAQGLILHLRKTGIDQATVIRFK
jgi:hypothetical protein